MSDIARQEVLTTFRQELKLLEKLSAFRNGVLLGQGHIVMSQHLLPLQFKVDGKTGDITDPRVCPIDEATRFSQLDAMNVARAVRNGAGEQAQAMHIRDAYQAKIDNLKVLIAKLEAIQPTPAVTVELKRPDDTEGGTCD